MAKYKRRAEWVWRKRTFSFNPDRAEAMLSKFREEANRYLYFRRTFDIKDDVRQAVIDVSADGRYQLFVNGQLVGRGPARCSSSWQYYDSYDIQPYLHSGRNVIAALVHSYGRNCSWYELPQWEAATAFGCGGWFVQGTVITSTGDETLLDTNESWCYLVSEAWKRDTPNGQLGFTEEYNAGKAPKNWQAVDFDDSAWDSAQILRARGWWGSNDIVPFPVMVKRDIPYLIEEIHWPASVVRYGEVQNATDANSLADAFQKETINDLDQCKITNVEAILQEEGEAEILTTADRSISVVLDFGKTEAGRVCFDLHGPPGAVVDFCYTERLQPDGRVQAPPWGDNHVYAHRVILSEDPLKWEMFDWGGFRYLQVTFRNCLEPLRVKWIAVNFTSYPVGHRGQFECSDELLNQIYKISGYTLQCCMHDSYEDCPSREQRQWTNDQYVHLMSNYGLFGDPHLARKLLVQVAQSQRQDGQVMMCAPGDFAVTDAFNMPEFTLHWIMSIPQYVRYTGDSDIIRELYPSVVKGLAWFEQHLDEDHLLNEVPGVLWIDWAEIDKKGQLTELNARFVGCLRIAAEFAERLGIRCDAERFSQLADTVSEAINKYLWDEERGIYVDTRRGGVQSRRVSQESNTAVMFFGVAPQERWPHILDYILDEDRLALTAWSVDHAKDYAVRPQLDEEVNVVMQQAFYMHFLHTVLAGLGRFEDIVQNIRCHWGPQVKADVTTWWEAWELIPVHSLCHAFACTPGFDLPSYMLGVTPLTEGFGRFRVAPQPADLRWAKGVFPSIKGDISVSWQWNNKKLEISLEVPAGTEAEVVLPRIEGMELRTVEMDGEVVTGTTFSLEPGAHQFVASYT
jgi:hypothetical protein